MRITIATGPLLPVPAIRGGAMPRIWQGLAEEFIHHGHDVSVFARAFPGQAHQEVINGVRYLRYGGFSQSLSIAWDLSKDFIYAASAVSRLPPAEILVINDFWLPVFAGWFRRDAGRIVINANRFPKGQYRLYQHVARVAAASTAVRNAIVDECSSLRSRSLVVPNPVNTTVLFPGSGTDDLEEHKTLLFVGRLHPEKGVHVLVEAFGRVAARFPEWRLQLVGPIAATEGGGGTVYQRTLRQLCQRHPVEFVGPVFDLSQLADIYRTANLFCYPSLSEKGESFGVAPLEAMACGVAPVVSSLECFSDYITDGSTGWVFNHRTSTPVTALAEVLEALMGDPGRIADAGKRAAKVAEQFSYKVVAKQYLDEFTQLLSGTSVKAA